MQRETGATISIEEVGNQGIVQIFADNKESIDKAVTRIKSIAAKPEVGEIYEGKVKSIMPFGAFVEIMPGKDGLLHISEIDHKRFETMDGIFEVGDEVRVKLLDIDKQGKLKLSQKSFIAKARKSLISLKSILLIQSPLYRGLFFLKIFFSFFKTKSAF